MSRKDPVVDAPVDAPVVPEEETPSVLEVIRALLLQAGFEDSLQMSDLTPEMLVTHLIPCDAVSKRRLATIGRLEGVVTHEDFFTGKDLDTLLHGLKAKGDAARSRMVQQARPATPRPEDVSVEVAADVLFAQLYPDVQAKIDIACEQLRETRQALMLGMLSYARDEALAADMTFVPDALKQDYAPASPPPVRQPALQHPVTPGALPVCQACQTGIPRDPLMKNPKPAYHQDCGQFVYACQTWANNAVRYPEMEQTPFPSPGAHTKDTSRWTALSNWCAQHVPEFVDRARAKQQRMSGVV